MNEHEKWQFRRIYHETYSVRTRVFAFWQGTPRRCKCGCGEVWYDRISPTNWWAIFNLTSHAAFSWKLACMVLLFLKLLWRIPSVIWVWFQMAPREIHNRVTKPSSPRRERVPRNSNRSPVAVRRYRAGSINCMCVGMGCCWTWDHSNGCIIPFDAWPLSGFSCDCNGSVGCRDFDERSSLHHRRCGVYFVS